MGKGPIHVCARGRRKRSGRDGTCPAGARRAGAQASGRKHPRRFRDNLDQKPAALNIVDFKDATRARLTLFNDTSHCAAAGEAVPPIPERRLSRWWSELATPADEK